MHVVTAEYSARCSYYITRVSFVCVVADVSDDGSSDVKEDEDLIQSDLRHRLISAPDDGAPAAVEWKPPHYFQPKWDIHTPESEDTTSYDTAEMAPEWDTHGVAEDTDQGPSGDAQTVAEMMEEDTEECQLCAMDNIDKDVIEEVHMELVNEDNKEELEVSSCLYLCDVLCKQQRKVPEAQTSRLNLEAFFKIESLIWYEEWARLNGRQSRIDVGREKRDMQ